jgi:hypothetical protein
MDYHIVDNYCDPNGIIPGLVGCERKYQKYYTENYYAKRFFKLYPSIGIENLTKLIDIQP